MLDSKFWAVLDQQSTPAEAKEVSGLDGITGLNNQAALQLRREF